MTTAFKEKRVTSILDFDEVQYLLRRLQSVTISMFSDFKKKTVEYARTQGDADCQPHWMETLPTIVSWNQTLIEALVEDLRDTVPDIDNLFAFAYLKYCFLNYGKDACGNTNVLKVLKVGTQELYHKFLVRLANSFEMTQAFTLQTLEDPARMACACANALCDALHDVSTRKVEIVETRAPGTRTAGPAGVPQCADIGKGHAPRSHDTRSPPPRTNPDASKKWSASLVATQSKAHSKPSAEAQGTPTPPMSSTAVAPSSVPHVLTPNDSASQVYSYGLAYRDKQMQKPSSHIPSPSQMPVMPPRTTSPHKPTRGSVVGLGKDKEPASSVPPAEFGGTPAMATPSSTPPLPKAPLAPRRVVLEPSASSRSSKSSVAVTDAAASSEAAASSVAKPLAASRRLIDDPLQLFRSTLLKESKKSDADSKDPEDEDTHHKKHKGHAKEDEPEEEHEEEDSGDPHDSESEEDSD
jgi:hypothetical protein